MHGVVLAKSSEYRQPYQLMVSRMWESFGLQTVGQKSSIYSEQYSGHGTSTVGLYLI